MEQQSDKSGRQSAFENDAQKEAKPRHLKSFIDRIKPATGGTSHAWGACAGYLTQHRLCSDTSFVTAAVPVTPELIILSAVVYGGTQGVQLKSENTPEKLPTVFCDCCNRYLAWANEHIGRHCAMSLVRTTGVAVVGMASWLLIKVTDKKEKTLMRLAFKIMPGAGHFLTAMSTIGMLKDATAWQVQG